MGDARATYPAAADQELRRVLTAHVLAPGRPGPAEPEARPFADGEFPTPGTPLPF